MAKKKQIPIKTITATEVLDMPKDKFESFIKDNHVTVGDASNLSFYFKSIYQRTTLEKDAILLKIKDGEIQQTEEINSHLNNMYLLLADIEQKVYFLTQYIKDLMAEVNKS